MSARYHDIKCLSPRGATFAKISDLKEFPFSYIIGCSLWYAPPDGGSELRIVEKACEYDLRALQPDQAHRDHRPSMPKKRLSKSALNSRRLAVNDVPHTILVAVKSLATVDTGSEDISSNAGFPLYLSDEKEAALRVAWDSGRRCSRHSISS